MKCIGYLAGLLGLLLPGEDASFAAEARDAVAAPETEQAEAPPPPTEFAFVFSLGYVNDHMPKTDERFEELVRGLAESGFNTIHCIHTDRRLELCRKHRVKMMVDLLAPGRDIRKDDDSVKALCQKLRGDDAVWGYNVWNDNLGHEGAWLNSLIEKVRAWDPTHPMYVGCYRNYGISQVTAQPGVFGWYDYHWRRGMGWLFGNLGWYRSFAEKRGAFLGKWILVSDYHRNLYTLNASIACGVKVVLWFIGGPWDRDAERWVGGHHLSAIAREVRPLYEELMRIGRPLAVYSTPTTKTPDNRDKEAGVPAPGLEAFPDDHWLSVEGGEAVLGFYRYEDGDDAIYIANHNALAPQRMVLRLRGLDDSRPFRVRVLDRAKDEWRELELQGATARLDLSPAGGELLRVSGRTR